MKLSKKTRKNKGFTLFEVVLVVGIISVLCGIAIPAVFAARNALEIKKCDDIARQVYVAAQNQMNRMKSDGKLSEFGGVVCLNYSARNLKTLAAKPQDYTAADNEWQNLYYLEKGDGAIENYLIESGSTLSGILKNGNYLVEFNPATGDVYGAFYSDNKFTYDDIKKLAGRGSEYRKKTYLGYYGGSKLTKSNADLPSMFLPKIQVINKEDLYLKITCDGLRNISYSQNFLKMQLTITDESYHEGDANHIWKYDLTGGDPNFFVSATGDVESDILLDSMQSGKDFKTLTVGRLTPGDNLNITVTFTYQNNGNLVSGTAAAATNSLFAAKTNGAGTAYNNVSVSNLRHLRNLDESFYNSDKQFTVTQIHDVDFNESAWDDDSTVEFSYGKPLNPLKATGFTGIKNDKLKEYDGSQNKLLDFDIRGIDNVGLFTNADDSIFHGINFVDCRSRGGNYVGLLAGKLNNCSVYDCKAYLSTYDSIGRYYDNMTSRLNLFSVTADGDNAGGLVGNIEGGSNVRYSLAAVNVNASQYAGGLIGSTRGSTVLSSYSSGDVKATDNGGYAGGITSAAVNSTFTDCYSTSDITAENYGGGFCATAGSCEFYSCVSYGTVLRSDKTVDNINSGAFCADAWGSEFQSCKYLKQGSYNGKFGNKTDYASATKYEDLVTQDVNSDAQSHAYSSKLIASVFPFRMLRDSKGLVIDHYGDWPMQVYLQTSLVYYEKYGNDDYGFYAKTSLTRNLDDSDVDDEKGWVVDTLKDKTCIEDGYALMTIYKLSDIYYSLNDKSAESNTNLENSIRYQKHLTTTDKSSEITDDTACLIAQNKTIQFKKGDLTYSISNARVYQLPFNLQMTKRYKANRFYDRIDVTGMVGNFKAMNNYVFYYCPDFAKNAVNPDVMNPSTSEDYPADPKGASNPVFVRSARQLNALGYTPYYWNPSSGSRSFYFKQETDIDFSKYTKNYCGKSYDLMDTSVTNPYRNRPIGISKGQGFKTPAGVLYNNAGNFRQTYDGMGHKIIDYCCETYTTSINGTNAYDTYNFTGLFGEAEHAVLKNIVMAASDPYKNSGAAEEPLTRSSGYVISHCNDGSSASGVGALCGISFVEAPNKDDHYDSNNPSADISYGGNETQIINCAVSGYDVAYTKASDSKFTLNKNYAVGGLVGFNFGTVKNCSVMNKRIYFTHSDLNNTLRPAKYVGGIAGSINGSGSIEQCSCGANIEADNFNESYFGMIAGGCDDISGYGSRSSDFAHFNDRVNAIKCCYSIANWSTKFFNISDRNNSINFVYMPVRKFDSNDIGAKSNGYGAGPGEFNDQRDERNVNHTQFKILDCMEDFYLKDSLGGVTVRSPDPWYNYKDELKECIGYTDTELSQLQKISIPMYWHWNGGEKEVVYFNRVSAANTFTWSSSQSGQYKYPAFVRKVGADGSYGDYVHYGPINYNNGT